MGKLAQALVHGAQLLQVDGNFDDCLRAGQQARDRLPGEPGQLRQPVRIEGQKTAAFEIVDALGDAPDIHCLPVGNAGNITAYWQGYREYAADGARHADPADVGLPGRRRRADRHRQGRREPETIATAIRIGNPPRGPRRSPPATSPAASSTRSPTARSSPPTGCWPAARACSSSPRRRPRSPACCRSPPPVSCEPGQRVVCTVTGNGLKDPEWAISGAPAPVTIPVDAAAAAAQLGPVSVTVRCAGPRPRPRDQRQPRPRRSTRRPRARPATTSCEFSRRARRA